MTLVQSFAPSAFSALSIKWWNRSSLADSSIVIQLSLILTRQSHIVYPIDIHIVNTSNILIALLSRK
jgi:hypothetical protein